MLLAVPLPHAGAVPALTWSDMFMLKPKPERTRIRERENKDKYFRGGGS